MNKIIVLALLLASTGCAATTNDYSGVAASPGGGFGGGSAYSAPERAAVREIPQREVVQHARVSHRDVDFVVCAQCRR